MIEIKIPIKLVSESNNTDHWTKKRKRSKDIQLLIKTGLKTHSLPPLPLQITLTRISPRNLDYDNLLGAFKRVRDKIAQMILGGRIGRKDNDPSLKWIYLQENGNPKEYAIKIRIEQCATDV